MSNKMITIIANIPARKIGNTALPAHTSEFNCDEQGQWTYEAYGNICESDVIDMCKKASNWQEIRSKHFRMEGFHN